MRPCFIIKIILLSCFTVVIINADKKFKNNLDSIDNNGLIKTNSRDRKNEYDKDENNLKKLNKNDLKNKQSKLNQENNSKDDKEKETKRFIGRIEHGKVKVLRKKDGNEKKKLMESEEDHKERVCRKTKSGEIHCNNNNNNNNNADRDNEEEQADTNNAKPRRIKYSIKFQHEKQKKREESSNDNSILRLHKNERKRFGRHYKGDEDDLSEEDEQSPIKKRYLDDEED